MEQFVKELLRELDHIDRELYQLECTSPIDKYGYYSQRKGIAEAKDAVERIAAKHEDD